MLRALARAQTQAPTAQLCAIATVEASHIVELDDADDAKALLARITLNQEHSPE